MTKLFCVLIVVALVVSCGKNSEDGTETAAGDGKGGGQDAVTDLPPSQPAIPDTSFTKYENLVAGYLRPYFDDAGGQTTKELEPGELFELYVFAEYNDAYAMSAAEYKLVVPEGITVLAEANTDSVMLTLGQHDTDFSITFHCITGPKNWLVRYFCKVEDGFEGGVVEVVVGNRGFMGFVECDASLEIRARGGSATLRRK